MDGLTPSQHGVQMLHWGGDTGVLLPDMQRVRDRAVRTAKQLMWTLSGACITAWQTYRMDVTNQSSSAQALLLVQDVCCHEHMCQAAWEWDGVVGRGGAQHSS
jgi:hypothetical protein